MSSAERFMLCILFALCLAYYLLIYFFSRCQLFISFIHLFIEHFTTWKILKLHKISDLMSYLCSKSAVKQMLRRHEDTVYQNLLVVCVQHKLLFGYGTPGVILSSC